MQYRFGTFKTTSTATATTITLGFVPSKFVMTNYTQWENTTTQITSNTWFSGMPSAYALQTNNSTVPATRNVVVQSNGVTPFATGALWAAEQSVITGVSKANPAVVTCTNTLVNGDIITISGVVGMIQLNTNRYVVTNVTGSNFTLYDLFGNPVDSTGYTTYTSGGIANCISTPPTAPVLNPSTGAVITPGGPPGNFYDTGYAGVILGAGWINDSADVWYWEAFYQTPTGW